MNRIFLKITGTLFFTCALLGVSFVNAQEAKPLPIRLATTTSTENSGLLAALLPVFEKKYGAPVRVIAVGTGQALKLGERGDVDVVLVHAREDEDKFVLAGFGVNRRDVMYNDFILVGPVEDPAAIRGMTRVGEALKKIHDKGATFVSRGDESGTHIGTPPVEGGAHFAGITRRETLSFGRTGHGCRVDDVRGIGRIHAH